MTGCSSALNKRVTAAATMDTWSDTVLLELFLGFPSSISGLWMFRRYCLSVRSASEWLSAFDGFTERPGIVVVIIIATDDTLGGLHLQSVCGFLSSKCVLWGGVKGCDILKHSLNTAGPFQRG